MKSAFRYLFFVLVTLASVPMLGQRSNILYGKVTDSATREPLIGATVAVEQTDLGTVTNANGEFRLTEITANLVRVRISFIGYQDYILSQDFSKNPVVEVNIRLAPASFALDVVEVQGKAEGQIRALVEQKKAESIKNIVSAEQIATFPDMNAAEVMQRIPGITLQRDQGEGRFVQLRGTPPELTNFNVNGEQIPSPQGGVRYVGMDIIPADQIDFIEVSKVMTPDMDADGIGGSVNVKTKEAAGEKPELKAVLAGGDNNLRQTPNYQLQFPYGQGFRKFGFNLNSSYFQNNQGSDNIEYEFVKGPFFGSQNAGQNNFFVQYREVQFRHYDITRTRLSVSPTLDFKFNEQSFVYLRAMYNDFRDNETRRRLIYELDDALSETYYLYGGIVHDIKDRLKEQELSTLGLGGEHRIGKATLDYQIFYAFAQESEPDRLEAAFESPGQAIAISLDTTDREYPRIVFPNPANAVNATNYAKYTLDDLLLEERLVKDKNLTPRINLTLPYAFSTSSKGYLKFGGKIRMKDKRRDIRSQDFGAYTPQSTLYPGVGPSLSLLTVDDGFREMNLLNKGYQMEYMPSPALLREFHETCPQLFVFDRVATRTQSFGEDYKAKEKIFAAYSMVRHDFGRHMLIGGLRYEKTVIDYQGALIVLDGKRLVGVDTLTDKRTHEFLLPQIQWKYSVHENFNIRAALTYTYSRPNFDDVLPYRAQDREEVKYGNPDLRYPRSTNVDFLVERYFGKGLITGGVFYKEIDDFVLFFKRFAHEGDPKDFSLVEITKAINGSEATVYGAELQAQLKLSFLPGFLKQLGIYANYTYTHSKSQINKRLPANFTDAVVVFGDDDASFFSPTEEKEQISLPGQAKNTANLALFFDSKRFFARLTANYHDAFLYRLGADADLDEYYDQEFRLDFTANYDVTKNLNVFADVINLTNTPLRYYLGNSDRIKLQEFYSWWGRMGVKLSF
ncbi:MAG: TonB-dependent receptor [Haliscomenobacter sp.]|nr:TonB-dependent receptor [Haliscomenobacter sp.]